MVKYITVRLILSLALARGWTLHQLNVNNAFLPGSISKNVYMTQPIGFVDQQHPTHICRLKKALYGLKQTPWAWYYELHNYLLSVGFVNSQSDNFLFVLRQTDIIVFLLLYVNDVIVIGSNIGILEDIISKLAARFSIKDLIHLSHFSGVEVICTFSSIFLSQ